VNESLAIRAAPSAFAVSRGPILVGRLAGVLAVLSVLFMDGAAHARGAPDSFADLAERLTPSVVNISTAQSVRATPEERDFIPKPPPGSPFEDLFREFFERQRRGEGERERRVTSLGSGFIIDPSGYVVTNNHVISQADEITVVLNDKRQFPAEVVGRDTKTDLAVLKIEVDEPLTAVSFGDSDGTRVGDWVMAIGNPFGLGNTVTAGILSARGRNINAGPYDDFLQTDAPINRGNSGGPLFNMDGDVIGINTAIFSPSGGSVGIGFAVPTSIAERVIVQLREFGHTRRGWLGVRIQRVDEVLAESLGLDDPIGALVADVSADSPAEEADLQIGDVIVEFDGKEIPEMRALPRAVAVTEIGKLVDVVVLRNERRLTIQVRIAELDESEAVLASLTETEEVPPESANSLGMSLSAITPELRERFDLDKDAHGVVVTDVDPTSASGERGIRPGDVILEVGLEKVETPAEVLNRVKAARETKRRSVLLLVDRAGDQRFVGVEFDRG
jgi:serine protease Do